MTSSVADLAGVRIGTGCPVAVLGALNVSPESFYPGSVRRHGADLVSAALAMVDAGAALVDVGARSTAPYLPTAIPETEEVDRLARAVEAVAAKVPVPVSADTASARAARAALDAGAQIVNDVSGLRDPAMAALVRAAARGHVLMASPSAPGCASGVAGTPIERVRALLEQAQGRARAAGIPEAQVVLDPGIGFFRDDGLPAEEWDALVLARLDQLRDLGRPLAVAVSRKSFVGAVTGRARPDDRLAGSLAAATAAVLHGAVLVRAHDVAETVDAVRVAERLRAARHRG
jgi:dihydropteroate synthase